MAIWVSSDWHCQPDKLKVDVLEWISQGKLGNHRLVADGDLFDILPLGIKQWQSAASIGQLAKMLDGYPFDYVAGNHDPYPTMKKLFAPYSNIKLHRRLEINEGGKKYIIVHGHRWSVDWGFLGLSKIAPSVVEFMTDHAPSLWYWICKRMGWLASPTDTGVPSGKERERINNMIMVIWSGATKFAIKRDCCVIIGHTHTACQSKRAVSTEQGLFTYLVDDGDLGDGTYVEITDAARLKFMA